MPDHAWSDHYEHAIRVIEPYILAEQDGTLSLDKSASDLGIDPVIFADLKRSLDETNKKINNYEFEQRVLIKTA